MKSVYRGDDLSFNDVGSSIKFEAEQLIEKLIAEYPEYSPWEMITLITSSISLVAARRVLDLRFKGKIKRKK